MVGPERCGGTISIGALGLSLCHLVQDRMFLLIYSEAPIEAVTVNKGA